MADLPDPYAPAAAPVIPGAAVRCYLCNRTWPAGHPGVIRNPMTPAGWWCSDEEACDERTAALLARMRRVLDMIWETL